jgi:ferritin-like metal-binding protein YciE
MQTAHELFIHELEDMLSAERQLVDALKEQEQNVTSPDLKKAISAHRDQTEGQVERLEQCFEEIGEEPEETECKGIAGLIEEYKSFVEEEDPSDDILDTVTISAASKVESYEINAYNSLIRLGEDMGHKKAVRLLQQNLREEQQTHARLEKLAAKIKPEDMGMEEEEEEEAAPKARRRRVA